MYLISTTWTICSKTIRYKISPIWVPILIAIMKTNKTSREFLFAQK